MDVVEGDSKQWARVNVMETAIAEIERGMRRHGLSPPSRCTRRPARPSALSEPNAERRQAREHERVQAHHTPAMPQSKCSAASEIGTNTNTPATTIAPAR